MSNLARLTKRIQEKRDEAKRIMEKFSTEFQRDPANALSWSNTVFDAAAKEDVYNILIKNIGMFIDDTGELKLDAMIEDLLYQVISTAKYPPQSTSPTSNLMDQFKQAAVAEALSYLLSIKENG